MRRLAADDAAEADDGVEIAALGSKPRRLGQLVGARHLELLDVGGVGPRLGERGERGLAQAAGDRLVETRDDDGKAERRGVGERHAGCVGLAHVRPPKRAA